MTQCELWTDNQDMMPRARRYEVEYEMMYAADRNAPYS